MCLGRRSPTLSGDSTPDRVGLRCRGCGTDYPPSLQYACPNCLGPLDVTYDPATLRARLDRATIEAGPRSIWRYAELLPTKPGPGDLAPGFTPLVPGPSGSPRWPAPPPATSPEPPPRPPRRRAWTAWW